MTKTFELSLRPFHGRLFIAPTRETYEKSHQKLFKTPDVLNCSQQGRFSGGEGDDGMWTYLLWGDDAARIAHELSHVLFHTFERCGIDARHDDGEVFCYMLSQLMMEALPKKK